MGRWAGPVPPGRIGHRHRHRHTPSAAAPGRSRPARGRPALRARRHPVRCPALSLPPPRQARPGRGLRPRQGEACAAAARDRGRCRCRPPQEGRPLPRRAAGVHLLPPPGGTGRRTSPGGTALSHRGLGGLPGARVRPRYPPPVGGLSHRRRPERGGREGDVRCPYLPVRGGGAGGARSRRRRQDGPHRGAGRVRPRRPVQGRGEGPGQSPRRPLPAVPPPVGSGSGGGSVSVSVSEEVEARQEADRVLARTVSVVLRRWKVLKETY